MWALLSLISLVPCHYCGVVFGYLCLASLCWVAWCAATSRVTGRPFSPKEAYSSLHFCHFMKPASISLYFWSNIVRLLNYLDENVKHIDSRSFCCCYYINKWFHVYFILLRGSLLSVWTKKLGQERSNSPHHQKCSPGNWRFNWLAAHKKIPD